MAAQTKTSRATASGTHPPFQNQLTTIRDASPGRAKIIGQLNGAISAKQRFGSAAVCGGNNGSGL
jgi:hypothetical protein